MASSKWSKAKQVFSCLYVPTTADDSPPPSITLATASHISIPTTPSSNVNSSEKICAICLMSMEPGHSHAIFTAECSHSFHFHCITSNVKHGNQICPICRAKWKEIPFHTSISSNAMITPNTFVRRVPPPRADPNRHISSVFNSPEPSVFDDDELTDPQPHITDENNSNNTSIGVIQVKTCLEVSAVSKSASHKDFIILVNLKALAGRSDYSRAPIDLVTVLDVSESMAGTKLALLKRAMGFVIHHLGPTDRLSVVAFSSNARRLFPLRRMTDAGKQEAVRTVNNLTSNGGTNIAEGLKVGVKILTERKWRNPVVSIILLSDGQDTYTISGPLAAQSDGNDGLRVPIHTFGFGADHDASAMHSIAEGSGGTFSFIEEENIIQDAFAQCIGGLFSVVVQELEVDVECVDPNIRLGSIKAGRYKNRMTPHSREGFISMGDLYAEEERDFLITVDIPVHDSSNEMSLLKVKCVYRDPITGKSLIFEEPDVLKIPRPEMTGELAVSIEVDRQRNRLRAAEAMGEAKTAAEQGDLDGAVLILKCFRKKLSESVSVRDLLCIGLAADVREMEERMVDRRAYESSGRAYVLSGMCSHSGQRATARGDSTDFTSLIQAYQTTSMTDMVTRSQILYSGSSTAPLPYGRGRSCMSNVESS